MCNRSYLEPIFLSHPGNGLPVWRTPSPAVTGPRPGHHGRTRVVVFLQGGPVLCGDRGVHLFPSSGPRLLIRKSPWNRPLPLWTAGGPGWPGGGHPAPYLCYQHQPANGARERRTLCKLYNLTRSNGEFTVDRSCLTWTFIGFLPSAVAGWISGCKNIDSSTACNSRVVRRRLILSDCGLRLEACLSCVYRAYARVIFKIQCHAVCRFSWGHRSVFLKFPRSEVFGWELFNLY